ncbi:MAG: hypothetical protein Q8R79_05750, partial [Legionellaceae bacterium]|nr:hypothetical protein [Legionellaceae bacterium]
FLKKWNPLLESLHGLGAYYEYTVHEEEDKELRYTLNVLLAKALMPAAGYKWIASNPEVLSAWLACLQEDPYRAKTFGVLFLNADAFAMQWYFRKIMMLPSQAADVVGARPATFLAEEDRSDRSLQAGLVFLRWLQESLATGNLVLNKDGLILTPAGVVISKTVFESFVTKHIQFKNANLVRQSFLKLALQREQTQVGLAKDAVLIKNFGVLLPKSTHIYHGKTGETHHLTATELIHHAVAKTEWHKIARARKGPVSVLNLLNAQGKWQTRAPETMALQKTRGLFG